MENHRCGETMYTLSKKNVIVLSVYYILLITGGIIGMVITLCKANVFQIENLLKYSIIGSIGISITTSSMQYLKKLYKICINNKINEPLENSRVVNYGFLLYFYTRPLFAIVLSIVFLFAFLAGLVYITSSIDFVINERLVYVSIVVSGLIGFSTGTVHNTVENISINKLDHFYPKSKKGNGYGETSS